MLSITPINPTIPMNNAHSMTCRVMAEFGLFMNICDVIRPVGRSL